VVRKGSAIRGRRIAARTPASAGWGRAVAGSNPASPIMKYLQRPISGRTVHRPGVHLRVQYSHPICTPPRFNLALRRGLATCDRKVSCRVHDEVIDDRAAGTMIHVGWRALPARPRATCELSCAPGQLWDSRVMAIGIAVAAYAALRAVLIYGEATELATRRLQPPRIRRAAQWSPCPVAPS
jgi:hypothetical protein